MESNTTQTGDALVQDVSRLKEDVAQLTADVKRHGRARVDDAKQKVNDVITMAQTQLAAHPFAILGFGVMLGFIFGRRGRRRRTD
jgi:ElaB/YqjD/DUF883 family membrane-anchored ribosome-binding protein